MLVYRERTALLVHLRTGRAGSLGRIDLRHARLALTLPALGASRIDGARLGLAWLPFKIRALPGLYHPYLLVS